MTISLSDAGKRYNRDWIFRHLNYQFQNGQSFAITGPNGSGKSTLLQVLGGLMQVNEGKCEWKTDQNLIAPEKVFRSITLAAPYLESNRDRGPRGRMRAHGPSPVDAPAHAHPWPGHHG